MKETQPGLNKLLFFICYLASSRLEACNFIKNETGLGVFLWILQNF